MFRASIQNKTAPTLGHCCSSGLSILAHRQIKEGEICKNSWKHHESSIRGKHKATSSTEHEKLQLTLLLLQDK
jgi:hypothetical protein